MAEERKKKTSNRFFVPFLTKIVAPCFNKKKYRQNFCFPISLHLCAWAKSNKVGGLFKVHFVFLWYWWALRCYLLHKSCGSIKVFIIYCMSIMNHIYRLVKYERTLQVVLEKHHWKVPVDLTMQQKWNIHWGTFFNLVFICNVCKTVALLDKLKLFLIIY